MEHNLILKQDNTGRCDCGEPFKGAPSEMVNAWKSHYATTVLLTTVRDAALKAEHARVTTEVMVGKLLELGVPAIKISNAIGRNGDGDIILSPFKVQSIAKKNMKQALSKKAAPAKKTARKTTIKKA